MPKSDKFFREQISFHADNDLYEKIVALGYLLGRKGTYAAVARDLLTEAVDRHIQSLGHYEKGQFNTILQAVRAEVLIKHQEREEKLNEREVSEPGLDLTPDDQPRGQ